MSIKAKKLKKGDTIAIVTLSDGLIGEMLCSHGMTIAMRRLCEYGFGVRFMPNALKGRKFIKEHPEARAEDLISAFEDDDIKAIICSCGGDDTYLLSPYVTDNERLRAAIEKHPKIFLGFSDTSINHFMLRKYGLNTFYGQSLMTDLCELEDEMLPYSKKCFEDLFIRGEIKEITQSEYWYDERYSFAPDQIGVPRTRHTNAPYEVISGSGNFSGKILGGCFETIYDMMSDFRYPDQQAVLEKYHVFPSLDEWRGKILLLETCGECPPPELFEKMLLTLKATGIFEVISGIIVGKPVWDRYYNEYKELYLKVIDRPELSIVFNVSVGHGLPRCIIPFGVEAEVRGHESRIIFKESILDD